MREQPFDFIHAQDYQQNNHPNWRASGEGSSRGFFRRHGLRDGVESIGFELKPNRSTFGRSQDDGVIGGVFPFRRQRHGDWFCRRRRFRRIVAVFNARCQRRIRQ